MATAADVVKVDESATGTAVYTTEKVDTLLNGKANTSLNNLDEAGKSVIKTMMADELAKKADKTALDTKVNTSLDNLNDTGKSVIKTTMADELAKKADAANVYTKDKVDEKLDLKADKTALNQATDRITANEAAITGLTTKTTDQQTAIDDLKKKTAEISHEAGSGTNISGVTIKDGNIAGNGNSAITGLTNVETGSIKTDSINGKSLTGTNVATEKNVADAVKTETDARTEADKALGEKITKNSQDIAMLNGKVATAEGNITDLKAKDTDLEKKIQTNADNIQTNSNAIATTDKRTGGITRNDAATETKIEGNVTVDNLGNVTAKGNVTADGKLKGEGVDAGTGAITTTGAVNAGSLNVTDASHLKGDVTMDNKLSVTGDTSLKKTDVDGALNAKDNVILGTNAANTVTVNGKSDFKAAVEMDKGLTVTNGDTSLKKTDVDGALNVTGESSLKNTTVGGTLTAEKDATFEKNVTVEKDLTVNGKLNVDKISMKNDELKNGKKHDSATTITADEISNLAKVTDEKGNTTESQFTHNEKGTFNYAKDKKITGEWKGATSNVTADGVSNKMTDSAGNTHTYSQTAAETKEQLVNGNKSNFEKKTAEGNTISIKDKDADGNKKSLTNKQTVDGEKTSVTNKDSSSTINQGADQIRNYVASTDGTKSSTEVKADGITNTSDGTITNDANHIENKANTMDTTVTGRATESYGELDTTVKGNETHTVTGNQTNKIDKDQENIIGGSQTTTVTGKVTENYKAGQATTVTGDQDITVSGTQTTTATDINRNASSGMIDTIDNDYGTNTETKVAGKTTTDVSIKGTGEKGQYIRGANESRDYLIKGTLKNSETKTVEKTSTEITDGTSTASTKQDAKNLAGSVTNGTETGVSGIHANDNSVSIDSIVTDGNKYSVINQKKGSIQSTVVDGTNSTVILQDTDNVTIASANGTVAIGGKYIVNNASESITNKAKTMDTTVTGKATESYGELETTVNGQATENYKGGLKTDITGEEIHTVTGNQTNKVTGKQTNTVEGGQENIISGGQINNITGDQTTIISGTQTTTATDINRNASSGMIDTIDNAYGTNTETKEAGKTTTDVSIKGTGEKGQYIRGANESRDYLIKGTLKNSETKTAEATSTEITDGTNKASTRQDAKNLAGSVTNGTETGVSGIHANNDGSVSIDSAVTDGTNTSVQNQTASQIATGVKDGAGNENASVANATTSANTITNGTKANTVISTADGTRFINSEANTAFEGGTYTDTTIKGNTITTGKVTMDYADVMKDLGVHGSATVDNDLTVKGITNTKTLNVTEDASVGRNLSVGGNATITGDVTANSYKVGDKTYISADGINANNQKITNVADGSISEGSKDAVNGGQLYGVKRDLEHQVDKVGANAAAMANLRPMEFDPSSKWNIAAAIGNYGSETAAALGAFYRPNDNVMVNLSTAFGTGENMVGGGVSVRLGKGGNKLSREETNALKAQVADLTARMDALLSVLNPNMSKDFPDVPENHWAYEAVSRLAGNDIVQGYPDGEFHGERTMTRYEMAEIIYNALSRGAEAEKELVEEFKPELQAMAASEKATAERAEG